MKHSRCSAALAALPALALSLFAASDPFAEGVRPTDPLTPEEQQKTFKLPPGFTVQLVAAEPELRKPMNMAFDGAGRLWITESREYPWATNAHPRDTIRIFSDFDANGRARKVTTFATNLNIPIGIYPFLSPASSANNEPRTANDKLTWKCIAWSIPNIWLFEDTDGDLIADKQEKLLGPFDFTRDTHGNQASFRRGLDGWIYATHGFNNRSRVAGKDGHEIFMSSGNTYRFRMDGSRIEHWTHGQVNPFGLTFDALGNLYSADCHSSPIYQLLRGAWYPSFGAPDDGLGFAPLTIQHSHGSTAICGITMLDDPSWPEEFHGQLIIGNVMTSRINRDRIEWRGSTSVGHELPDLVSVTDPWFRPVDLQLGPDGALWVADFYNRIIGHYEVPLTHPLRDRERGRIWRIVPPKTTGGTIVAALTMPTKVDDLVAELGSQNRTRRTLAINALADRFGAIAVSATRAAFEKPVNEFQRLHALWLLNRFDALKESELQMALASNDALLRVHALRLLTDRGLRAASASQNAAKGTRRPGVNAALRSAAIAALNDSNAFVQRAAADALGADGSQENVAPLVALIRRAPKQDNHLRHTARIALRDCLRNASDFTQGVSLDEANSRVIADVCPAITNAAAASFLVAHLQKFNEPRDVAAKYLRHAARFLPERDIDNLASLARDKFRDDIDLQAALFKSVQEGLQQRGVALSSRMKLWGSAVADDLLSSVRRVESDWIHFPVEGATGGSNPWVAQRRASADRLETEFLSTLPSGEPTTGVLRSKTFAAPAQFTFWMAGHDGFPDKPLQKKNFVALKDAESFEVLKSAPAPRNDTAQKVTWDLKPLAGKQVFLELVDGDTAGSYAWLAVGRFEPAVVTMPKLTPKLVDERLQSAAQLALATRDQSLEAQLAAALKSPAGADARASLATTLLALNAKAHLGACSELVSDASAPSALRQKVAQAIADSNTSEGRDVLVEVLRGAPDRLAPRFALALAGSKAGSEALLVAAEAGKFSARVLQDRNVKEKVLASKASDANARIAKLTKNLTPVNEELQKQVEQRRAAFKPAGASITRGAGVFTKTCAACHQIDKQGALVGPQLDGIGSRGLERIIEDIVDPNRNVDHAFVSTTFILDDGDVVSGLFRREEGETIVYAEANGKESTVPKSKVKERRQSELSLMPEGLADALTPQEFNDLMAFLLSKTGSKNN
jgi:putative heme-binding domain-containing protein